MTLMSSTTVTWIVVVAVTATMTAKAAMATAMGVVTSMATVMLVSVMAEGGGLLSNVFFGACNVSSQIFLGGALKIFEVKNLVRAKIVHEPWSMEGGKEVLIFD
jgi:hypothetical protein